MDCLIIAPKLDGKVVGRMIEGMPGRLVRTRTVSSVLAATGSLVARTPDQIVILGDHDDGALERFCDMADVMGCDQIIASSLTARVVTDRRTGARPVRFPVRDGQSVLQVIRASVARNAASHAIRARYRRLAPEGAHLLAG